MLFLGPAIRIRSGGSLEPRHPGREPASCRSLERCRQIIGLSSVNCRQRVLAGWSSISNKGGIAHRKHSEKIRLRCGVHVQTRKTIALPSSVGATWAGCA
jgi:hypothetical protein